MTHDPDVTWTYDEVPTYNNSRVSYDGGTVDTAGAGKKPRRARSHEEVPRGEAPRHVPGGR